MDVREYIRSGLIENILNADDRLVESKSASEWWDAMDKKGRAKLLAILGMNKGKDKYNFAKLEPDERDEIRTYFSKHKGKVESVENFNWNDVPEGGLIKVYSSRVKRDGGFDFPEVKTTPVRVEAYSYAFENRGKVVCFDNGKEEEYYTRIGNDIVKVKPGRFDKKTGMQEFLLK